MTEPLSNGAINFQIGLCLAVVLIWTLNRVLPR